MLGSNEFPDIHEVTMNRCSCSHGRADQMGSPARTLTAFKIAVAGGCATFAGLQPVGIHGQAHGATRLTPFKTGGRKDLVQPFALGLLLDESRARHNQSQLHVFRNLLSDFFDDSGRFT